MTYRDRPSMSVSAVEQFNMVCYVLTCISTAPLTSDFSISLCADVGLIYLQHTNIDTSSHYQKPSGSEVLQNTYRYHRRHH